MRLQILQRDFAPALTTSCYGVCICALSLTQPNPISSGLTAPPGSYSAPNSHFLPPLDYCHSVLYGLPESTLLPLTIILHQAARLCLGLSYRDHVTPALCALH